jgi:anti-sigma factor RsiW
MPNLIEDHIPENLLEDYVCNKLPESQVEAIETHLLTCPLCRKRCLQLSNFVATLREVASHEYPEMLHIDHRNSDKLS